ncbi:hypothetical protein [Pseudanabaena sp. FACHB-2040]|uniref:hypothetical protein n=1 Tax=Pseudanabaena sp. FACHB-2040 TaxID=2692859 RepID=UPI0016866CB4|nr:hypothetical protein [Pseudanabaena sp. FACHB-2040]MBD2261069.1 hypothetical protein [Pseudanabaena sp. FACHB-2040]
MYFLLNELSFVGQFRDYYEVKIYMNSVQSILSELNLIRDMKVLTHQSLCERELFPGYKFLDWLRDYIKQPDKDLGFLNFIVTLLQQGCVSRKLDDEVNNGLHYWKCETSKSDYSDTSLAGAAYFRGKLISIKKSGTFDVVLVSVRFTKNTEDPQELHIENIFEVHQAQALRPKFLYHSKHDLLSSWENATPMDLSDLEAQEALDRSVEHLGHTQRYSFFRGKFYVFQYDNAGGYHGYPVERKDVPNEPLKDLIKG